MMSIVYWFYGSIRSDTIIWQTPRSLVTNYRTQLCGARWILVPLRNEVLVAGVGVDDRDADRGLIRDPVPGVVLEEIDLLGAIALHPVRVAHAEVLASHADAISISLIGEDAGEGDAVDVGAGPPARPLRGVVDVDVDRRLLAEEAEELDGGTVAAAHAKQSVSGREQ